MKQKHSQKALLCAILLLGAINLNAQNNLLQMSVNELRHKADSCFIMASDYKQASAYFSAILQKDECQQSDWFNGACAAALAGETDIAFARLNTCFDKNKNFYSHTLPTTADLVSLHNDKRWLPLCNMNEQRRNKAEKDYNKELIAELQDIGRKDQSIRWEYIQNRDNKTVADSLLKVMRQVDIENQERIFKILDEHGWPSHKIVGESTGGIFVILQHSGLENQKKYLPQVKQAVKAGDVTKAQYALYEDRINVFEGKPQRYGTQLNTNEDGTQTLCPLKDPQKVDKWRKKVGLEPLDDYLKSMSVMNKQQTDKE